ncbi:MAG: large-conductance mechanosensitive channel protein MscL [Thermoflexibacter sp.]|jgi:large conductance mechanosensitive channel|nr:large-conductance mechanosensitive channel protein MscL [Thermoflexibacter sp.]
MGFISEFKEFAMKGNLIDFAVGVVIGGAFAAVSGSFVNDIFTPPIGLLIDNVDFTKLAIELAPAEGDKPAVAINYGKFLQAVINFIIVAFVMFLVVKGMNAMKKQEAAAPPPAPPEPTASEKLLAEIRDLLKK